MPSKLGIWNDALRMIGEHRLTSLTEDTEARYVLEDAWADAKTFVFTEGLWNFATVTGTLTANVALTPIPGFTYAFDKPTYWLRTITVSSNSLFDVEALYRDEANKLYANVSTLYIRYISSEKSADGDIANWPSAFAKLMAAYLANICANRISGSKSDADGLKALYKEYLASAKNKDALDQSQIYFAPGSWVRALRGSNSKRDRGPLSGY